MGDASFFERLLRPLQMRIAQVVSIGVITNSNDDGDVQLLQARIDSDEPLDGIELVQPYGFASRAFEGAKGLFFAIRGWRSNTVCGGAIDTRYRLRGLKKGESALYDDQGNYVWLERGQLHVKAVVKVFVEAPEIDAVATVSASITAPNIALVGTVAVTGALTLNGVPVS